MTAPRDARNGRGPLRLMLEAAGISLTDGTVLAPQNDPYRQDTPAGHRDGQWFADRFAAVRKPQIHLRGLHYAIVARGDVQKPDGVPYRNTDEDWVWLQERAAKAARWLGYVPFSAIVDQRSDAPIFAPAEWPEPPASWIVVGLSASIDYLPVPPREPTIGVQGFACRQRYQLVIFGEKSSLAEVVLPIARAFGADAYLETGEISDSHLYEMARRNAEDGRPLRVFTIADFDPAGWQMPVSIGRKLQALRDLEFPMMDFEVRSVALNVEQVRAFGLPSTPLKAGENRAEKWRQAWGHEQTEIDALATLQPDVLADLLRTALEPFYDLTLAARLQTAEADWLDAARQQLRREIDSRQYRRLWKQTTDEITRFRTRLETRNRQFRRLTTGIALPEIVVPEADVDDTAQKAPLISSAWSWLTQTRALRAWKAYDDGMRVEPRGGERAW